MINPIFVRELLPEEIQVLETGLRSASAFTTRRCQIVLHSAEGQTATEIARQLRCDDQTVRNAIHAFNDKGLAALTLGSSRPHTIHVAFDEEGVERLRAMLHQSPRVFGEPTSVWTLKLAAKVAFAEGLTASQVTGETIRYTLKRLGMSWRRAKQWISSPDPAYALKKTDEIG